MASTTTQPGDTATARRRDREQVAEAPLSGAEAAEFLSGLLGVRVTARVLRYHSQRGGIPHLRLGGRRLYWPTELVAWKASGGSPGPCRRRRATATTDVSK